MDLETRILAGSLDGVQKIMPDDLDAWKATVPIRPCGPDSPGLA